jgi:prevent-host-death family protein
MPPTFISVEELAQQPDALLKRVDHGELLIVGSAGKERAVLMDAVDYRLLRGLAACAIGPEVGSAEVSVSDIAAIREFLAGTISLGKVAELLEFSRFDVMERFRRLDVPLGLGPSSLEDALAEIAVVRSLP